MDGQDTSRIHVGPGPAPSPTWPGGARPRLLPDASPPPPEPLLLDADTLPVDCAATRGPLFRLALKTGALTVITLGFYRFWMKSRLRRWYWSSVRPGGLPLEYVGEPLEKLLGFLIAVALLAFYIGVVNLLLMFLSLSVFEGAAPAFLLSFVGVIPLWFYARYRARRYVLGRTRWRGLRFGMDPGAWGYAKTALGHWAATILTLGLLWPRMTFALEKYRTDRTWFGSLKLRQTGDWRMLVPAFTPLAVAGLATAGIGLLALFSAPEFAAGLILAVPAFLYAMIHYTVTAKRLMAEAKRAGDLRLSARPRPPRILRIYLFGGIAMVIVTAVLLSPLVIAFGVLQGELEARMIEDPILLAALGLVAYMISALIWATLTHVFITMPKWRHYAETLTLHGAESLPWVHQRHRDEATQAEGFAEALDVGAAI